MAFNYLSSLSPPIHTPKSSNQHPSFVSSMSKDVGKQADFMMQLLLAQLKNQYPGEEMDTDEMLQTVISMMTATQQAKTNELLSEDISLNRSMLKTMMNSYVGDFIDHIGTEFNYHGEERKFKVDFPSSVNTAELHIVDEMGTIVKTLRSNEPGTQHTFTLNIDSEGGPLAFGEYHLLAKGITPEENTLIGVTTIRSFVSGIRYDDQDMPLLISDDGVIKNIKANHRAKKNYDHVLNNLNHASVYIQTEE